MGSVAASPAPWDVVPRKDQLFVLVTGANSGIGLGIAQRVIDEFLCSRLLASHLILITTTRSQKKSQETTEILRDHVRKAAQTLKAGRAKGHDSDPETTMARVHLLSVQVDLCNLPSIYAAAARLVNGMVPRLDSVIFNAGIGAWLGLNWPQLVWVFLTKGIIQSCTWPPFKMGAVGRLVDPLTGRYTTVAEAAVQGKTTGELLGETFCANVFGHYMLAHRLLPLLARRAGDEVDPGRIIWESSIEASGNHLSLSDMQGTRTDASYESSKRIMDIMSLTAGLPRVRPFSAAYLRTQTVVAETKGGTTRTDGKEDSSSTGEGRQNEIVPPRIYLCHPGVVVTPLFPLTPLLLGLYRLVMVLCRYIGSPWHPVDVYKGAVAPVWLALQSQDELDDIGAERVKWGSSAARDGTTAPKRTEVDWWGWDGRLASNAKGDSPDQVTATGVLRDSVGRKRGAVALTAEAREDFEETGAEIWKEMERLRLEWEDTYAAQRGKVERALAA